MALAISPSSSSTTTSPSLTTNGAFVFASFDIAGGIFEWLNPRELEIARHTCRTWRASTSQPFLWNGFLKPIFHTRFPSVAKATFLACPIARVPRYVFFDQTGHDHVEGVLLSIEPLIKIALARPEVSHYQQSYLNSPLVRFAIVIGEATIEKALASVSPTAIEGLNPGQISGMLAGLTRARVEHDWFTTSHSQAAQEGLPYEVFQGLTSDQVDALIADRSLTREHVNHAWFTTSHKLAACRGFSYEMYQGLTSSQVQALAADRSLTREHVNHAWFTASHKLAAYIGLPYEMYQGLTSDQVEALIADHTLIKETKETKYETPPPPAKTAGVPTIQALIQRFNNGDTVAVSPAKKSESSSSSSSSSPTKTGASTSVADLKARFEPRAPSPS